MRGRARWGKAWGRDGGRARRGGTSEAGGEREGKGKKTKTKKRRRRGKRKKGKKGKGEEEEDKVRCTRE